MRQDRFECKHNFCKEWRPICIEEFEFGNIVFEVWKCNKCGELTGFYQFGGCVNLPIEQVGSKYRIVNKDKDIEEEINALLS